jgi:hypothetical protein
MCTKDVDNKYPQIYQNIIKYATQGQEIKNLSTKSNWILAPTGYTVIHITVENVDILLSSILVCGHFRPFVMSGLAFAKA